GEGAAIIFTGKATYSRSKVAVKVHIGQQRLQVGLPKLSFAILLLNMPKGCKNSIQVGRIYGCALVTRQYCVKQLKLSSLSYHCTVWFDDLVVALTVRSRR